ncbi:MAG: iron ABC transporter permease [Paenibacillaceae bacterium]
MYIFSGGFVLFAALLGLLVSSVTVPVPTIINIILQKSFGLGWKGDIPRNVEMIIWHIRFPRVLLALFIGAALSLAGAAFQGLLRNPLADPFTIGVSSGATLGAVSVLYFQINFLGLGTFSLPVVAILGGFVALMIVFGITRLSNRGMAVETIILAGIIISSFISAIVSLIIALSSQEDMRQILYWMMGSVGMRGWSHLELFMPFFLIGAAIVLMHHRELNALAVGEESAQHLGVDVKKRKIWILIGASLLTGSSVAVSGSIGFVGLVIPHLVRLLTGPNHRHVLPLSMLMGGAYLVLADLIARTIIAPKELPIGVITALIGAPVFAVLLMRRFRRGVS